MNISNNQNAPAARGTGAGSLTRGGLSYRVGLVGAGYVATYHARALRTLPWVEICGVADPDETRAKALAAQFAIPRIFPSLAAMTEARPNVIHVLTPPASHAAVVLEALDLGCHVFVEKPMAESVADCDRMIARARELGLALSVNHSARMDPIVLLALERLRAGACGEIMGADFFRSSDYAAYSGGPAMPPWFRNGSYPFQDLGVHGLYLLEAFLGPIQRADIRYYPSGKGDPNLVFDEWRAMLECERGTGQMYISWNVRPIQNEVVVQGTKGVMHVDCYLQTLTVRPTYPGLPKPVQRILAAGFGSLRMLWKVSLNTLKFATGRLKPSPGIHVSVVKFHEALHRGEAPPVPAEEGRRAIALLEEVSGRADADKVKYLAERPPVRPPRILVTGANGFLGRALVARLRESGEPLRLLVRRPPASPPEDNVHLVYGDLGNPAVVDRALEGIDLVYHVGAAMKGGNFEFSAGTIWGTRNVIDACERHGVKKLVYVSSMSVLDQAGHTVPVPVNEGSPYEPRAGERGLYTQTKLEAEKMVREAAAAGRIRAVILRPGQIYGKGAEKFPPSGTINLGRWLIVGAGNRYVPFVYVENVVDALLLAAERDDLPNGAIYQLVDPEGITQRAYVDFVRASGRTVKASYVPAWFLKLAGVGVQFLGKLVKRPMPLTPYRVRSITPLWPCDCSLAERELGWKSRVSIREGLERTFHGK